MEPEEKVDQFNHELTEPVIYPFDSGLPEAEPGEIELTQHLARLDFSRDSKVRENLRIRLEARSGWIHLWLRDFPYWAGFAVLLLLTASWVFNPRIPNSIPSAKPQATAYASSGSSYRSSILDLTATLPAIPKPIPTPQAGLLSENSLQSTSPSMTISPYSTPNITQRTGFH